MVGMVAVVVVVSDAQLCSPVLTSAPNFIFIEPIILGGFSHGDVVGGSDGSAGGGGCGNALMSDHR